jgi:hypothetical protein
MGGSWHWWDPAGYPRTWWLLLAARIAVGLGVAVAVHGFSDSSVLAVVALFTVIGALEPAFRGPARPRPTPLPIPRHPWIALASGLIATASWAITHFALRGRGQEVAPGVVYIAGVYIWLLRDWGRDRDRDEGRDAPA